MASPLAYSVSADQAPRHVTSPRSPLALLGFAIFRFVLDDPAVLHSVQRYLAQNLPRLDVQALRNARGTIG